MDITYVGHAGFVIETKGLRILCDPWFTPAYFTSWFPFPRNDNIDKKKLSEISHLYVSHPHRDHFDRDFLKEYIPKDTVVILPPFPLPYFENELRSLGFTNFFVTEDGEVSDLAEGVSVTVFNCTDPTDGGTGDSCMLLDDSEVRVLHLNDAHPQEMKVLKQNRLDLLLLQFSGASWYPNSYEFPTEEEKLALSKLKRENQSLRALSYIHQLNPKYVVPCAGPACFLDERLFHLNDFDNDPTNIFPDQQTYLTYLKENEVEDGFLMLPGSKGVLTSEGFEVSHVHTSDEISEIFDNKYEYLRTYQKDYQADLAPKTNGSEGPKLDLIAELRRWWIPLLVKAPTICRGVNGNVVLDVGDQQILIDFNTRRIREWDGEPWIYHFSIDRKLVEACVEQKTSNWPGELFLSFFLKIRRVGQYNEFVYAFFRCLSREKIDYFETHYNQKRDSVETLSSNGYTFERFCPHAGADLKIFGSVNENVITCMRHGWQFDLETGECLTSENYCLKVMSKENKNIEGDVAAV